MVSDVPVQGCVSDELVRKSLGGDAGAPVTPQAPDQYVRTGAPTGSLDVSCIPPYRISTPCKEVWSRATVSPTMICPTPPRASQRQESHDIGGSSAALCHANFAVRACALPSSSLAVRRRRPLTIDAFRCCSPPTQLGYRLNSTEWVIWSPRTSNRPA